VDNDVDLTLVADGFQASFVTWGATYLLGVISAIPGLSWLSWPVISTVATAAFGGILDIISKSVIMQGFFMYTAYQKGAEARDFATAVAAKAALPPTATDEDYKHAEEKQILAFCALVHVGG
jgi:hypothetical protein